MKSNDISCSNVQQAMAKARNVQHLLLCSTHSCWNTRQKLLLSDLMSSFDLTLQKNCLGYLASIDLSKYGICMAKVMMVSSNDQALAVLGLLLDEFGIDEDEGFYRYSSNADCAGRINRYLKEISNLKEAA